MQKSRVSINIMHESNTSEKLTTQLTQNCERCVIISTALYAKFKKNAERSF